MLVIFFTTSFVDEVRVDFLSIRLYDLFLVEYFVEMSNWIGESGLIGMWYLVLHLKIPLKRCNRKGYNTNDNILNFNYLSY